jgi:ornithine decarboxylase
MNTESVEPESVQEPENLLFLSNFLKDNDVLTVEKNITKPKLIETIIEKYNPNDGFYIVDIGEVYRRYTLWTQLFPFVKPYFALKSCPNSIICRVLGSLGCGFDVASVNEINLVKDIVSDMNDIIFANPVKSSKSIIISRTSDVDNLVFDSQTELYKIKLYHEDAKLFIRIKVDDCDSVCRFSEKFGVEKNDIEPLLQLAKNNGLNVVGVSFHVGSSCKNAKQYYSAIELARYTFKVAKKIGYELTVLDIGGGFAGHNDENSMQLLKDISSCVQNAMKDFFSDYVYNDSDSNENNFPLLKVIAEPGRFFVTTSHTLVVSIIGRKEKVIDNSLIFHYTIDEGRYSSFSAITYDYAEPEIIPYNNTDVQKYKSVIFGNTCDSFDKVSPEIYLPKLSIGDKCYVQNFGAYTVSSASNFNGFSIKDFFYVIS